MTVRRRTHRNCQNFQVSRIGESKESKESKESRESRGSIICYIMYFVSNSRLTESQGIANSSSQKPHNVTRRGLSKT